MPLFNSITISSQSNWLASIIKNYFHILEHFKLNKSDSLKYFFHLHYFLSTSLDVESFLSLKVRLHRLLLESIIPKIAYSRALIIGFLVLNWPCFIFLLSVCFESFFGGLNLINLYFYTQLLIVLVHYCV